MLHFYLLLNSKGGTCQEWSARRNALDSWMFVVRSDTAILALLRIRPPWLHQSWEYVRRPNGGTLGFAASIS